MKTIDQARMFASITAGVRRRLLGAVIVTIATSAIADPVPTGTYECVQAPLTEATQRSINADTSLSAIPATDAATSDNSCWVDFSNVAQSVTVNATWIDVRSLAETKAIQLPGALRIAMTELRTKTFLKNASIVLVGSGRDDGDIATTCGELKRSGFPSVIALRGGVRAWIAGGRPILGEAAALQGLDLIAPMEFQRQAARAPWIVVGVDLPSSVILPGSPTDYRAIAAHEDAGRVVSEIRSEQAKWRGQKAESRPTAIIVVTVDADHARRARDALRTAQVSDVFVLQGGVAAYRDFLNQQHGIAAASGKALVRQCGSS
jgi:rhodanese-related sulfurtransferase